MRLKKDTKIGLWQLLEDSTTKLNISCLCTGCNKTKSLNKWNLLSGKTTSCGCQRISKMKKTNLEKYGVEFTQQDPTTKQKSINTLQERYNVDNFAHDPTRKQKSAETSLERYGVEHYSQTEEFKKKVRKKAYGKTSYGQVLGVRKD